MVVAATCVCCSATVDWWVRLRSHPDLPICHGCLGGLNAQRDGQLQLAAGKWIVRGFEPILRVADIDRAVVWFERVGFEVTLHLGTYALAHREKGLTIHLAQVEGDELAGHGALYIHCQDADEVAADLRNAGIQVEGPRDQDYGKREGSITDPDGNVIRFGSTIR